MKKYKVLTQDLKGPFQSEFQYEVGKKYVCDDFDTSDKECSRGFYATDIDGLIYTNLSNNKRVFEVEVSGKEKLFDTYKQRFEKVRVIKEIKGDELHDLVKEQSNKMDWDYYHALFPPNPFKIEPKISVEEAQKHLKEWASVWASVGASVWSSVWASVGVLFPNIKNWKYIDNPPGVYPFQSSVDLWKAGLTPVYYNNEWKLYSKYGEHK